jgi:peptidoglycan/xylan/chitin deacetylase (PgdA/CDA1 family)
MTRISNIISKVHGLSKKTMMFAAGLGMVVSMVAPLAPTAHAATSPVASLAPGARISFTFDDGLTSALSDAAPTLAKYGYTGTDYVITQCVGMTTAPNTCHANTAATYMSWDQIKQLSTTYGWEVASHTQTHPYLASSDATDGQPNVLTPTQVAQELSGARTDLAAQGYTATDIASPYGDWTHPVLAQIAQNYTSHRGFADSIDQHNNTTGVAGPDGLIDHANVFPYNDYLLYDLQVQAGVTVAQVESYIDQSIAAGQWLILTFHNIKPTASTDPADYEYNTADLDAIAAYIQSKQARVVTVNQALVNNDGNLMPNSSFNTPISATTTDTTVWSTTDPTAIKQDTASHGNYPDPTNSVLLGSSATANVSLYSPQIVVDPTKKYIVKNFLNVDAITAATGHEIAFYVEEWDAAGTYLLNNYKISETSVWLESLNFEYIPSSAAVAKARLTVVVTAGSGTTAYLDSVQWFAEDGSTTTVAGTTGKPGDANGDGKVDIKDATLVSLNWGKTGATMAQGDVNADGTVNIKDATLISLNWGK